MRKTIPFERVHGTDRSPEFKHTVYDIESINADYANICKEILLLQFSYDMFINTDLFEVEY